MRLSDFQVLTFDCYGTLIDWESGLVEALSPLTDRLKQNLTRNEILEAHAVHESAQQRQTPAMRYSDLLQLVYRRLSEHFGLPGDDEAAKVFGRSVGDWPAFPDTREALSYLKRHFKLIILSNVDRSSFALTSERLGTTFDQVLTAVGGDLPADHGPVAAHADERVRRRAAEGTQRGQVADGLEQVGLALAVLAQDRGESGRLDDGERRRGT